MNSRFVLDTHVWVWLMLGDRHLGKRCRRMMEEAVSGGGLLVSAISVWEVAMLEHKGRLTLAGDCEDWVHASLGAPGIQLSELTPRLAIASTRLPGPFHGDPADRIIVATARESATTLITADLAILRYADLGHVNALSATR